MWEGLNLETKKQKNYSSNGLNRKLFVFFFFLTEEDVVESVNNLNCLMSVSLLKRWQVEREPSVGLL